MWGSKGFLISSEHLSPHHSHPLLILHQKSHPKKNYKKRNWMKNSSTFTLLEAEKQWHQRDVLIVQSPPKLCLFRFHPFPF
jgi:hypothetical protein